MDNENKQLTKQPYQISKAIYKCSSTERKILYYAGKIIQIHPTNEKQKYIVKFSISAMLKAMNMNNIASTRKQIKEAIKNITENTIKIVDTDTLYKACNWVQYAEYNEAENAIILHFTDYIGDIYIQCKRQFALINLETIGQLKSYYSMRYYEIALSWSGMKGKDGNKPNQWYFTLSVNEIREKFQIKGTAKESTMILTTNIVKTPIAELNKVNEDFKIEIEILKDINDERKTQGYKFICTDLQEEKKQQKAIEEAKLYSEQLQQAHEKAERKRIKTEAERAEIARENNFIDSIKKKYPQEFYALLAEKSANMENWQSTTLLEAETAQEIQERHDRKELTEQQKKPEIFAQIEEMKKLYPEDFQEEIERIKYGYDKQGLIYNESEIEIKAYYWLKAKYELREIQYKQFALDGLYNPIFNNTLHTNDLSNPFFNSLNPFNTLQ